MAKKKTVDPDRDELAQLIADSLNKLEKGGDKVAFFLDGGDETPTDLDSFVSTGATELDLAISNRPHGGIGVGRITEISGLEGSGKSLLCAEIIANTQRMGGVGVIIDTENATNPDFLRAVGVDTKALVYSSISAIETVFEAVVDIIERVRSSGDNDKVVTIVVDSIAGASSKEEMNADFDNDGYNTHKARAIGKALRKITTMIGRQKVALIFTNQLRVKMNAMPFSDPYDVPGGKAIPFAASTRIRLRQAKKIKNKKGDVIGIKTKAELKKNRLGPPHRTAEFDIFFDRGIDDYSSWLKLMKESKLVKQGGAWYTYTDKDGEEHKFQSKDFPEFLDADEERKERIYQAICESVITRYVTEFDPDSHIEEDPEE